MRKIPMLLPVESSPKARDRLTDHIDQLRRVPGVLSASFLIGYPFANTAEASSSAVVVTDNDEELAEREAARFADLMWSLRDEFAIPMPRIDEAIERAIAADGGPFVFCDLGDCLFAGGTGDVPGRKGTGGLLKKPSSVGES